MSVGSREQPRGQYNNHSAAPSAGNMSSDMSRGMFGAAASNIAPARAGPSTSENVIIHTDGGAVGESSHATSDVKEVPTEAPPAYAG